MKHEQRMEEAAAQSRLTTEAQVQAIAGLVAQMQQVAAALSPPDVLAPIPESPVPTSLPLGMISEPWVGTPEHYDGTPKLCGGPKSARFFSPYNPTHLPLKKLGWHLPSTT